MKLRFTTWILISVCCVATLGKAQETADVAYFEMVRVKPGDNEKFEDTLKRHWIWHQKARGDMELSRLDCGYGEERGCVRDRQFWPYLERSGRVERVSRRNAPSRGRS